MSRSGNLEPPGGRTQEIRDLQSEDRMRERIASRRQRLHQQLEQAFSQLPPDSPEAERGALVQGFLQFVADNIDRYATRSRVTNPHTGEVVDAPWLVLCGATIRALDVPRRIQRLVLELVDGVLPEDDRERRQQLFEAAGLSFAARASAANVRSLEKKGMLAAFSGKLLVDSRHLISEHTQQEAEEYFEAARRIGAELEASPYRTDRDRRFLQMVEKRYGGGVRSLVDAQREVTLSQIERRDAQFPALEGVLRSMLDRPFGTDRRRSIDDWYIAARIAFQSDRYVYRRIDEFRAALETRTAEIEAEPMLNPDATREAATEPVAACIAALESTLKDHGATLAPQSEERLDVMQVVRENAALLARPELVGYLDRWLADPELLEHYARYRVAAFRQVEPDLRAGLQHELVMWDELFRSAPITEEQRHRLDDLRDELLEPLRARGAPLPDEIVQANMLLPFGQQVLPLLKSEAELDAFGRWMRHVRAVFNDRPTSDEALTIPEPEALQREPTPTPTPPPEDEAPGEQTARWYPTLIDVQSELDEGAVPARLPTHPPGTEPPPTDRPHRGWLKRWLG
jgi:hypothetical protein